jgi:hypothetical protein
MNVLEKFKRLSQLDKMKNPPLKEIEALEKELLFPKEYLDHERASR